jgi:hypothetical protein
MVRRPHENGAPIPRDIPTRDHKEPRTYGGPTTPENIIAACLLCNNLRGEIDAVAFKNLVTKWFKRDPTLKARWHTIEKEEFAAFKRECMHVHERQLRGLGIRSLEHAFRHFAFVRHHPQVLHGLQRA